MRIRDGLWLASIPFQVALGGLAMGVVAGVALLALPVAFITLPVWLPIHWYFTNVWHADERAKRAAAELETRNLMDACANPHFRRKEDHWWRGAP